MLYECGASPLHLASARGDLAGVRAILSQPRTGMMNKPSRAPPKWTPLMDAVASGHVELVQMLLRHGAQTRGVVDEDGCSPLWIACQYGHVPTLISA